MGVSYEMNWYLVISNIDDIYKCDENIYVTVKNERRLYPVNSYLPIIIKNIGCIGLVKIISFKVSEGKTEIEFSIERKFDINSEIAKHYFLLYKNIKNTSKL